MFRFCYCKNMLEDSYEMMSPNLERENCLRKKSINLINTKNHFSIEVFIQQSLLFNFLNANCMKMKNKKTSISL